MQECRRSSRPFSDGWDCCLQLLKETFATLEQRRVSQTSINNRITNLSQSIHRLEPAREEAVDAGIHQDFIARCQDHSDKGRPGHFLTNSDSCEKHAHT